jgi:hypothetical protein
MAARTRVKLGHQQRENKSPQLSKTTGGFKKAKPETGKKKERSREGREMSSEFNDVTHIKEVGIKQVNDYLSNKG